jgi:hypothetical protein
MLGGVLCRVKRYSRTAALFMTGPQLAARVEFEALIDEARDITMRLTLWNELTPQTKRC